MPTRLGLTGSLKKSLTLKPMHRLMQLVFCPPEYLSNAGSSLVDAGSSALTLVRPRSDPDQVV